MKRLVTTALGCILLTAVARADVVVLKDGRQIEGTVIEQTDQRVVIQTRFGINEFSAAEVERVDRKATPQEEFKSRRASAEGDAKALYELYLWAQGNGLKGEAKRVLRDVIEIDPDHENARKLLGYVRHDGEWMTAKEKASREAAAEQKAKEGQGFVRYRGEWITPEEKEKRENEAKGLIEVDGEWVNKKEYERRKAEGEQAEERRQKLAEGLYEVNGKWVPKAEAEAYYADLNNPYRAEGDHVYLYTNHGIDFGDRMLVGAEAAWRAAQDLLGADPGDQKLHVFVVRSLDDYNQLGNIYNADEQSSNFYTFSTPWLPENDQGIDMASVTQFNQADSLTELYVRHAVAEQFVRRLFGADAAEPAPRWFGDAVAAYVSRYHTPELYTWSRERLLSLGGVLKLKSYFGSYQPFEQYILGGGALVAWIRSSDAPEEVKTAWNAAVAAVKEGKRVQKAFRDLEKVMTEHEDAFRDFAKL